MKDQKTVLIVEDERPLAVAIKAKMEKKGFTVVLARSVQQALSYLEEGVKIDVIWLDHYLVGVKNGLDLVATIKQAKSKFKKIPIYVVSNTATPDKIKSYLRLGVNKYYTKADTKLEDIIADINKFLISKTI